MTLQSLNPKQVVDDLADQYGHVIVDECHHISAVSFEQILRHVKARYITGLTATPQRKEGHHPIIIMQCGPIRHRVNAEDQALARPFKHFVVPRPTNFRLPPSIEKPEMHELYAALADNKARNDLICVYLLRSIKAGRPPILLPNPGRHLESALSRRRSKTRNVRTKYPPPSYAGGLPKFDSSGSLESLAIVNRSKYTKGDSNGHNRESKPEKAADHKSKGQGALVGRGFAIHKCFD